jgi:soluble lytic murein transglycosylase
MMQPHPGDDRFELTASYWRPLRALRCVLLATWALALPMCTRSPRVPMVLGDMRAEPVPVGPESDGRVDWRLAVGADDWRAAMSGLDALAERERREPRVRFARALAAQRLGDCDSALSELLGLVVELPALNDEIQSIERLCQLAVGAFDAKAQALSERVSFEDRLEVARGWRQTGRRDDAIQLLDRMLEGIAHVGHARRDVSERARQLRAELSADLGLAEIAAKDYLWLATVAVTDGADVAFERLSGTRLTAAQRTSRASTLAKRGAMSAVRRELELLRNAPGNAPARAEQIRILARATYHSRADDVGAARLYEKAWRLSKGTRVSDAFRAARAWTRARQVEPALSLYAEIRRRYAGSRAAERALYATAYAHYVNGRWAEAARGYTDYLRRYARDRRSRFVQASRYERAISALVLGDGSAAFAGFEHLRRGHHEAYRTSLLEHLEAVSLVATGEAKEENDAVRRFKRVVARYPLSFAALASAARLEQMGIEPPRLDPLPALAAEPDSWGELPEKMQLLADIGLHTAAERALHEAEPSLLARHAPRGGHALCDQYGAVDRGYRRYSLAATVAKSGTLQRPPTASNLWLWHCLYPRPYTSSVARLEQRYRLPSGLIHSVMRQESAFRTDARSAAGAVGLMQLMPTTAERAARELVMEHPNERLTGTIYNLELGAFYLNKLLSNFDRRVVLALAGYNAGPHAAFRWLAGGVPLALDVWAARIPFTETRHYVQRVMANWARYRYLDGGPDQVPGLALHPPQGLELPADIY